MTRLAQLRRDAFTALSVGNYRLFFAGQSLSLIGTWMQSVAQSWLVLELTQSATWVGLAVAAQMLPILLVAPYGGLVADRVDKRRLLVGLQSLMGLQALLLAVLTISGRATVWQVLVLALLLGCASSFENPARQAFVLEMVGPDKVRNAVSLNAVMVNAARAVGPAVAGVIIAAGSIGTCFLVNAGSFAAVVVSLLLMDPAKLRPSPPAPRSRGQLRAGLAHVRRQRDLLVPLVMMAIIGCFAYEFAVTLPIMARGAFGGNAATFGTMTSAMGIGAVVGGLYSAARGTTGIAALVRASVLFGVFILAAALARDLWLELMALALTGGASVILLARGNTTLQLASEPDMRGRVMALWTVAFLGSTPIGGPIAGWVAESLGPRWGLVLGAVACFVAAGIGVLSLPARSAQPSAHPDSGRH